MDQKDNDTTPRASSDQANQTNTWDSKTPANDGATADQSADTSSAGSPSNGSEPDANPSGEPGTSSFDAMPSLAAEEPAQSAPEANSVPSSDAAEEVPVGVTDVPAAPPAASTEPVEGSPVSPVAPPPTDNTVSTSPDISASSEQTATATSADPLTPSTAVQEHGDKKMIVVLGAVAVVLIAAIAVLLFR